MRFKVVTILALVVAGASIGCATSGDGRAAREVVVVVGTGEWQFEPLVNGQDVTLAAGSQGGFHVWTSVVAHDIAEADVLLDVTTTLLEGASGVAPEHSSVRVSFTPDPRDQTAASFLGWPARLLHPGCADGRLVRLAVDVTDRDGAHGHDERDVRVHWNPPLGTDPACDAGL